MHDKAKPEPKTAVWWDINSCLVPDGHDARMVGKSIESALYRAGYAAPITITAFGNLKHTLKRTPDVLPAIYSSGIRLTHVFKDGKIHLSATLMPITGVVKDLKFLSSLFNAQCGYTILLAYPQSASCRVSPKESTTESLLLHRKCIWETLLKDAMAKDSGETSRHAHQERICETVESSCRFCCALCKFVGHSFEDFKAHLKSRDHLILEVDMAIGPPPKRKLVKPTFNVSKYIHGTSFNNSDLFFRISVITVVN